MLPVKIVRMFFNPLLRGDTLGLNVSDIAEFLKISEDTVRSNLPYTKGGCATGPKSENAKKIAQCRANKKAKSQKSEGEI